MSAPAVPPDTPAPLRALARHDLPHRALTALHRQAGEGTLVHGPAGHALAPAELVASARRSCRAGLTGERLALAERELTTPLLARLGLAAVHSTAVPRGADRFLDISVLWVRLGMTERLLDAVTAYLGERSFGDMKLSKHPVLKDTLAGAAVSLLQVAARLCDADATDLDDTALRLLHHDLGATGRALLDLLGAYGLTEDGPGAGAYVCEVLADLYAPGEPEATS
ncbi:hypothetical protein ME763_31015 [Streptomyces murinus]|uniref:hypothetical protein n=1 Tax=Streptomyces murinus TaxID=33900 RepID=UPI000A1DB8E7|nr:hypothetical protein [Streptomyces murinus]WDO09730.1 hypothetical protein ME763_31015 [Streptomyces murinus]